MSTESKFLIGIGFFTVVIITAGVFFFSRSKPQENPNQKADETVLYSNTKNFLGDTNAPVKIVEFADMQCPACRTAQPILKSVLEKHKGQVYFIFRHYPLSTHKNARQAAKAVEAASLQGKIWEMVDLLFTKQPEWSEKSDPEELFAGYAQELGLDVEKFKADLEESYDIIDRDFADGNKLSVSSTPTFFINGEKKPGALQKTEFEAYFQNFPPMPNTSE